MNKMETFILASEPFWISSQSCKQTVDVNFKKEDMNVTAIRIDSIPDGLCKIILNITGVNLLTWVRHQLKPDSNLLEELLCNSPIVLPLASAYYHSCTITFEWDKEFVKISENEINHIYSDTECDFYDGDKVRKGRRVIDSSLKVMRPNITFELIKGDRNVMHQVAFWDYIVLKPYFDQEYIKMLCSNRELRTINGSSMQNAMNMRTSVEFYAKNILYSRSGMISRKYLF